MPTPWRTVRVFISSTFPSTPLRAGRDMQAPACALPHLSASRTRQAGADRERDARIADCGMVNVE